MNIRECEKCGYVAMTSIKEDYNHKICNGLMKLMGIEYENSKTEKGEK